MKAMKDRIYFAHYGQVWSMRRDIAIGLCLHVLAGENYDLNNFGKMIKRTSDRENNVMKVGRKYHTVHHCLDWSDVEWKILLEDLNGGAK